MYVTWIADRAPGRTVARRRIVPSICLQVRVLQATEKLTVDCVPEKGGSLTGDRKAGYRLTSGVLLQHCEA